MKLQIRRMRVLGCETYRIFLNGWYVGQEAPSRAGAWTIMQRLQRKLERASANVIVL